MMKTKTIEICQLMMTDMMKAITIIIGARTIILRIIWMENWTLVTSVVRRVMSEAVEKWSMFLKEKS